MPFQFHDEKPVAPAAAPGAGAGFTYADASQVPVASVGAATAGTAPESAQGYGIPMPSFNTVKGMGAEAAGSYIGTQVGLPFAEFGGMQIGSGLGGGIGNAVGQLMGDKPFSFPQMLGAAVTDAAFPGATLARPVAGQVVRGGVRNLAKDAALMGAAGVAGANAASYADNGAAASGAQDAASGLSGIAAPFIGAGVGKVLGAKGPQFTPDEDLFGQGQQQSFRALRGEGVKVLPQNVGLGNDTIGALAGRTETQRQIDRGNQAIFQKLARRANGFSEQAKPLFHTQLDQLRDNVLAKPYEQFEKIADSAAEQLVDMRKNALTEGTGHGAAIQQLDFDRMAAPLLAQAKGDVNALKVARKLAQNAYSKFSNGDPAAYDEWQKQVGHVDQLNTNLVEAAKAAGQPDLAKALDKARERYAISYATQAAIPSPSAGLVDISKFGQMIKQRPGYLTGDLEKMGNFANDFPRDSITAARILPPGMNNLSINQQFGQASAPGVLGKALALTSKFTGPLIRSMLKKDFYQNYLSEPQTSMGWKDFSAQLARRMSGSAVR